jgi:hypothetical protein
VSRVSRRGPPELELLTEPELGIIGVLDAALVALRAALISQHPTLIDELAMPDDPKSLHAAQHVVDAAHRLSRSLVQYRRALAAARAPPPNFDDLPF